MVDIPALINLESARWSGMVILSAKAAAFSAVAERLCRAPYKAIYQEIEVATGVPWFATAVIHERESSQNFARSLAQGDPWNAVSTHVPRGRGPFKSFKEAAADALADCPPRAARWTDWSAGGALTILEEYNGLGYAGKGVPSPYVWAGTNQYVRGKYTSDGHYDPSVVDSQLGVAGLLRAMSMLDNSVQFGMAHPTNNPTTRLSPSRPLVPVVPSPSIVPRAPGVTTPAAGSIGAFFAHLFHR